MAKYLLTLIICIFQIIAFAQREFGVCDSTFYNLNNDTTIIAGRHRLYLLANNSVAELQNFSTSDPDEYIRDFDIINPNLWYTVVGFKFIGLPTKLYKSTNKGQTWSLDTNHYNASNAQNLPQQFLKSINNLQHLNGDTLIMFMHYYESGIIYSTDLGQTWSKWFDNLIAHYQGMFFCNNKYYLYGYQGDGFRAWMFGFDKNLLFSSDSTGLWNSFNNNGYHPRCSTSNDTTNCIYTSSNLSRCETYNFFKNKIENICSPLNLKSIHKNDVNIYPNPSNGILFFDLNELLTSSTNCVKIQILNFSGQIIYSAGNILSNHTINTYNWNSGLYHVLIFDENQKLIISKRIIRE